MENANDKTLTKNNDEIAVFHRPKDSLLERVQLAMLYVMDECGDDVMDVQQQDICNLVDIPDRTFRDNFSGFDAFLYWSKQELIGCIMDVAKHIDNYAVTHGEAASKTQMAFLLLKWLRDYRSTTMFALRRFGLSFWWQALSPLMNEFMDLPTYYAENLRDYAEKNFTATFIVLLSDWMKLDFDVEKIETYSKLMIAHARQIAAA